MDDQALNRLKQGEKEILCVFDAFCKKHGLRYSLFAGTALGAVRHGGFIPWDDDIDVCMERSEYDTFRETWGGDSIDRCFLEGKREAWHLTLEKVRSEKEGFKGIWIDVFPLDKVPKKARIRKKLMRKAKLLLVYTRNYPYTKGGKLLEMLSRILLACPKWLKKRIKASCSRYIEKFKDLESGFEYACLTTPDDLRFFYPETMMRALEDIRFEDETFPISKEYDTMLTVLYGDYMTPPPEDQRVGTHSIQEL